MSSGIYIGMSGAAARARAVDAVADNLANADTPGFKSARVGFEAVLAAVPEGSAAHADKAFARPRIDGVDLSPGVIENTGRPLDVVPPDQLFLGVQTDEGSLAYTRNGALLVDGQGLLRVDGHLVLGAGGAPIAAPPGSTVQIADNGRVVADGVPVGELGFFALKDPVRLGGSLLVERDGAAGTAVRGKNVTVAALERSNRPAVESAVELMRAQKSFMNAMQVIDTYHRLDGRAVELARRS